MGRALIAAALLFATTAAFAATPHGSWRPLDDLAAPATAAIAAAPGLTGTAQAWGDPSTGCFGVVQELHTEEPVADPATALASLHASLHDALEAGGAQFTSWTAERGVSSGELRRGGLDAQIRTVAAIDPTGALSARSAVCFYNERDAARSRARCKRFLESL